jgi:CTP:molybdopterin cytidylyltransferase MocA
MGEPKQLLPVRGRPLLESALAAACDSPLDEVIVVLGSHADEIRQSVRLGRARVVVNAEYAAGLSTSLKAGIGALSAGVERAVIILGDQPDITADVIDRLLRAQTSSGLPAAALSFDGLLHPPVVLARELWGDIEALEGDVGLRALVRAHPELVAAVEADSPGGHPIDIDTREDFEQLAAEPA